MLESIKNLVWGPITVISILLLGTVLLIKTRFRAVYGLHYITSNIKRSFNKKSFGLMCTSLGGTIGVGNAIGVAGAICEGGVGAVFWMAVAGLLGMTIKYVEVYLALKHGGPIEYIEKESGIKFIAVLYSVLCILVSLGMGNTAQVKTALNTVSSRSYLIKAITAIIIACAFIHVVIGGIDKIRKFSEVAVPSVSFVYTVALIIIIIQRKECLSCIFKSILDSSGIFTGVKWSLIKSGISSGFSKAIFSTEAGLGSAGFAHSESNASPVDQANWAVAEVFIDSLICFITAIALLSYSSEIEALPESLMTQGVFIKCFGDIGRILYSVSMTVFAFSSIICWYYNGLRCVRYLKSGKVINTFYIFTFVFLIIASAFVNDSVVITLSDIANGLMLTLNLCTLWTVVLKNKLTF